MMNTESIPKGVQPAGQSDVLTVAMRAGEILLKSGAETYRVEETIIRICNGFGHGCEAFVLPTGIFMTVEGTEGILSSVKRIGSRQVHLSRIAGINALSREIVLGGVSPGEALRRMDSIVENRPEPFWRAPLIFAVTAGTYTILFGGSLRDGLLATGVGALLSQVPRLFPKRESYPFLEIFTSGLLAGLCSAVISMPQIGAESWIVLTGSLINLLPGVAIVNGIRDLLNGDNVSGMTRLGEAMLSVFILASGAAIGSVLLRTGGLLP